MLYNITPFINASGTSLLEFAVISVKASSASALEFTLSFTPPTSVLWSMSGDDIFITTGNPILEATLPASFEVLAKARFGNTNPYDASICIASYSPIWNLPSLIRLSIWDFRLFFLNEDALASGNSSVRFFHELYS